jgi:hypothetical protein
MLLQLVHALPDRLLPPVPSSPSTRQHVAHEATLKFGERRENTGNSALVRGIVGDRVGEAAAATGLHSERCHALSTLLYCCRKPYTASKITE